MGGQNHQPTNRGITAASAWLSQKVGEGFIDVLAANNHLENAIMLGMNKLHVEDVANELGGTVTEHMDKTIAALEHSLAVLRCIPDGFERLLTVAHKLGYKGNPFASQLDRFSFEHSFSGKLIVPAANKVAWDELHARIRDTNILATLSWEAGQFAELTPDTEALIAVLRDCHRIASTQGNDTFVNAIENNEVPLRQWYARVFSRWNHLHATFLYSALIMTELFYKLNDYPSLLDFTHEAQEASRTA